MIPGLPTVLSSDEARVFFTGKNQFRQLKQEQPVDCDFRAEREEFRQYQFGLRRRSVF